MKEMKTLKLPGQNEAYEIVDAHAREQIDALGALATQDKASKQHLSSDVIDSLNKADTALQSYTETDPTVPNWAKAANKPTYTASEVGADESGTAAAALVEAKLYTDSKTAKLASPN